MDKNIYDNLVAISDPDLVEELKRRGYEMAMISTDRQTEKALYYFYNSPELKNELLLTKII